MRRPDGVGDFADLSLWGLAALRLGAVGRGSFLLECGGCGLYSFPHDRHTGGHSMDNLVIERLSDYAHSAWSGWIHYMFGKSIRSVDGSIIIPAYLVEQWDRQAQTAYNDLPENEKGSDRAEANKIIEVIGIAQLDASGA